ncbi:2-hydroxyacid dehydrogenase [Dickeya dianthicola]|uniref:2-hydroxyacid dehydrogenase n=1 Tax=Dickeya dianthicola TaxID=204039 RepID=UPI001D009BF9|nr:glyoxylate/hydroxypyruvate reductase A [Dickeya dianthicola]MCI4237729.1 glyoxylate/hydroxypyruvate reductase A [Dickeya dianthicola]MCI4256131.1 glyoxylate/hydroxypyruvate reductase A [Dickeya dianthicola]
MSEIENDSSDTVLMLITSDFVKQRYELLKLKAPDLKIVTNLNEGLNDEITAMFTFSLPEGIAPQLPKLRLVASVGAGADGILKARDLPQKVKVTRACDAELGFSMAQYVVMQILRNFRDLRTLEQQHATARWSRLPIASANQSTVGIMGLGQTGMMVAKAVAALGFRVTGWTRTALRDVSIERFVGMENLNLFLEKSDFLICLLPLTDETRHLLNRNTLSRLRKGCYVINVARGGIIVEQDLLELVENGYISGAALDVFTTEPLNQDSPFWGHDKILVTPHIAAQPSTETVVDQFIENLNRIKNGFPLLNEVDRNLGY